MESLVGYGSDDECENDRYGARQPSVPSYRRREDDTNYDDVNMDMSEGSDEESEPELPQAGLTPPRRSNRDEQRHLDGAGREYTSRRQESPTRGRYNVERNDRNMDRNDRAVDRNDRNLERNDRNVERNDRNVERNDRNVERNDRNVERNDRNVERNDRNFDRNDRDRRDRKSPRREERYDRTDRGGRQDGGRRGLLGDRPDGAEKMPSLMDVKPFGGDQPRSYDARDAVSPRFIDRRDRERSSRDRDRTSRDKDRNSRDQERERDRSRHSRRSEERRSGGGGRSRSRPRLPPSGPSSSAGDRRPSPTSTEYRPSYKVNKKLEVMEKMGLQIKTPCGSMATAQQLRAAASSEPAASGNKYFNPGVNATKILDQVQKRKLLWANKAKSEAAEAAKWTGTKFSHDQDGKQVNKFMRLMGIKQPEAIQSPPDAEADPNKKQEELFQAMQAQYEVARATTHTMRGVGLGFQRGQY